MPPKTRTNKATKSMKENACPVIRNKSQKLNKVLNKPPRRALADKTNSASDDNASTYVPKRLPEKVISTKKTQSKAELNGVRPRRARRIPNRFKENSVLQNLSNSGITPPEKVSFESKKSSVKKTTPLKKVTVVVEKITSPVKKIPVILSPKANDINGSLIKNRPKRICRLPSKFDEHSTNPNSFIPLQPVNCSTPLASKRKKASEEPNRKTSRIVPNEALLKQKTINNYFNNSRTQKAADANNNAKKRQNLKGSPKKSPEKVVKKNHNKNFSIKILDDNKKSLKRDSSKLDVYEFTFDPEEEPPPAKKKKKKTVTKRQPKPKTVKKSNYDKNLAKALAALKDTVASKKAGVPNVQQDNIDIKAASKQIIHNTNDVKMSEPNANVNKDVSCTNERIYNSVRIEDIAMDMQADDDHNIDYSPVNSPSHPKSPAGLIDKQMETPKVNDPLNLQDDISFFDEQPAASSSMNVSLRHPQASPWRVEFGNLPIRWQVNTYVKPNMTPAFESSFINFNDSKKNHVYTNMVADENASLPRVVESTPNFKQTSIMSFIKEVVEKSANKKKKSKSTPVKANSLFEDLTNTSIVEHTQKKQSLSNSDPKLQTPEKNTLYEANNSSNLSNETENSENHENVERCTKSQKEKVDKNVTYFGFDEHEDQENISPKKKKARSLRSRTRRILHELNTQKGPMRAVVPIAMKTKPIESSDLNKLFDGMKSATEPPVFSDVAVDCNTEVPKVTEPVMPENLDNDDNESVHLFEDIELLHHHKMSRKSYGKPKKVTFNKPTANSDSSPLSDIDRASSDEDLDDLSFKLPSEKPKKTIKRKKPNKQKLSKKEEKEVEAWAAGFNSMCEDVDEFDLVVE